ncbi:MAG: winged helix-turn-helix domain-containing protein [Phenylobacterium sp.]
MESGELNASGEINLARADPLRIGRLTIVPATRQADWGQGAVTLEPRVIQVLVALADRSGQVVSRDELIERCWKGQVVGDNAIQRAISQLRRLAADVGEPGFEIETIARVGYRLTAPTLSPISAAAPSDAEPQRTDEGAPATVQPGAPNRAVSRPISWRVGMAAVAMVLILAIGATLMWRAAPQGAARPPGQNSRVDVMMLAPQGADPAAQKIAGDLSQTLVRVLASVGVQVAQRPEPRSDAATGSELRILGTVEREGSAFVFNPEVVDQRSGAVLWTTRLVLSAQEEAASPGDPAFTIAGVLRCALADRDRSHIALTTEAFGLYLNACAGIFDHTAGSARMLTVTRQLTQVAPDFAGGHAMHAIAAATAAGRVEHSPADAAPLHTEAKDAAERALKLDPNTPKAYAALALNAGAISDRPLQDWLLEERYILQALKLDPDLAPARVEYNFLLRSVGRFSEAVDFGRMTDVMDPRNHGDQRVATLLAAKGDLAGAEALLSQIESATRRSQDNARWTIAVWWEDPKTAVPKVRSLADNDTSKADIDCLVTFLKELERRRATKARGLPPSCGTLDPAWQVRLLAREGDVDGAFAAFEKAKPLSPILLYYPEMRAVRADPRFWPLATEMGLADYWLKSGHWPDFCAEPNLPYDCRKVVRTMKARSGKE